MNLVDRGGNTNSGDNTNNEHKTREKLKEINDEIDLRVVKKRKLIGQKNSNKYWMKKERKS